MMGNLCVAGMRATSRVSRGDVHTFVIEFWISRRRGVLYCSSWTTALAVSRGHWTVAAVDHFRPSLSEYPLLRMRFYVCFSRLLPSRHLGYSCLCYLFAGVSVTAFRQQDVCPIGYGLLTAGCMSFSSLIFLFSWVEWGKGRIHGCILLAFWWVL